MDLCPTRLHPVQGTGAVRAGHRHGSQQKVVCTRSVTSERKHTGMKQTERRPHKDTTCLQVLETTGQPFRSLPAKYTYTYTVIKSSSSSQGKVTVKPSARRHTGLLSLLISTKPWGRSTLCPWPLTDTQRWIHTLIHFPLNNPSNKSAN